LSGTDLEMPGTYQLPLSVLAVAAGLTDDFETVIFDQRTEPETRFVDLLARRPIAVGISSMTGTQILHGLRLSRLAKQHDVPTIWGSWHPTLLPKQTLEHPDVDYVVTHEGELGFADLVRDIEAHGVAAPRIRRSDVVDWNAVAPVPYHLVDCEDYLFNAQFPHARVLPFTFSRGCPFQCAYCATGSMFRKWQPLHIDTSVERMLGLVDRYDLDMIKFTDENITTNKKVFGPLAEAIGGRFGWLIQSRMDCLGRLDIDRLAETGLRLVSSGLESGSPRILEVIKKKETVEQYIAVNQRLAKTGIRCTYNFMMAIPGEVWEDVMQTVDLALRMIDDNSNAFLNPFYTFVPYPGCALADEFADVLPTSLDEWAKFDRFNAQTPFSQAFNFEFSNIAFSSKYVGRRFLAKFPGNTDVEALTDRLTWYWRRHDFSSKDWWDLRERNQALMDGLFGRFSYDGVIKARYKSAISNHAMQKFAETKEPDGAPHVARPTDFMEASAGKDTKRSYRNVGATDY
ncbi:B12-binding domain-containing radical SAM protein, partial [Alphaproteobacteria bacterium]|nr:B12-binding domain-containing radical SAM protein [Alphaproteobacteria bacterium]